MKAIRLITSGGKTSLELHDEPLPKVGRHEALVRVHAASLNFRDQAVLNGPYKIPSTSKKNGIPLSDGAGEVVAVGEDVTRVKVGDRVAANCFVHWIGGPFLPDYHACSVGFSLDGMLAEHVRLHENAFVHLPAYMSYIEAASLLCGRCGLVVAQSSYAPPAGSDGTDPGYGWCSAVFAPDCADVWRSRPCDHFIRRKGREA
jgi:NADPH:quinone reductase-like Zn-dependent oxidoreductase